MQTKNQYFLPPTLNGPLKSICQAHRYLPSVVSDPSRKAEALAVLAADIFEKIEKPETWKEFSKTPQALALRKANRFGAAFNELGEVLQTEGLRTHYLGVLDSKAPLEGDSVEPRKVSDMREPFRRIVVRQVSVVKPTTHSILGRAVPDYEATRKSPLPRLIPLEVVFRFSAQGSSSIVKRVEQDPGYLASLGFSEAKIGPGVKWDFPVLELFTKLEPSDRIVPLAEALSISGLAASQLQEVMLKTAWVAGWLKYLCARSGLELADGKLEWGLTEDGKIFLVDAIGLDELRILKDGVSLSKEFLREYYRTTLWFKSVEKGKTFARIQGADEWKRFVQDAPAPLPPHFKELGVQVFLTLVNELTGRNWLPDSWTLEKVVSGLKQFEESGKTGK